MRKKFVWSTVILIGLLSTSLDVSAQAPAKRRTPRMTSEDATVIPAAPATAATSEPGETVAPEKVNSFEKVNSLAPAGTLAWERDLGSALRRAKEGNRLVVVDVYTDWCGWCKKMDKTTYADPQIVALSRQEVFVKLNAEDGGEGQQFARGMRVTGYPTTIILDGEGRPLARAAGYIKSAEDFLAFVEEARSAQAGGR